MLSLFGAGIGRGITIGYAYVLKNNEIKIPEKQLKEHEIEDEVKRFKGAVKTAEQQFKTILKQLPDNAPTESEAFIQAHMLMLSDPLLVDQSIHIIETEKINAEQALQIQSNKLIKAFEQMQDSYLSNKQTDVRQITNRLLRNLLGIVSHTLNELEQQNLSNRIIVAKDLTPTETMAIKKHKIKAFVTDLGSQISHTAIVARSLRLPAVVGLRGPSQYIKDNDLVIVDGKRGIVIVNPADLVLKQYQELVKKINLREKNLKTLVNKPSQTKDKKRIHLLANIESNKEIKKLNRIKAHGVGLFRTEYLFMNRLDLPSEDEQFKAYKQIISNLKKPVAIRTLDIGGDKQLEFDYPLKNSSQSPLGLRAVRLCLNNVELFKPQLRAILRASAFGKTAVMIPMLCSIDEVEQTLNLIKQTKLELKQQKIAFDKNIPVGGMIEVPAAAIMAVSFAKKLDFLSIGTNDLIQYTLAIDRVDDAVKHLYDPINPAVLRLIKHVIQAGKRANIPVSLCGEMAGNVRFTRLLLGLGLTNFSMDSNYILDIKEQILNTDTQKLDYQVKRILNASCPTEARERLRKLNQN